MNTTDVVQEAAMRDFHHPYQPYDIQNELMNVIFSCIDEGKIGILESPTGTGKSLSLICGSLTWLRNFQQKALEGQLSIRVDSNEPAWVVEHEKQEKKRIAIEHKLALEAQLKIVRAKELHRRRQYEDGEPATKRTKTQKVNLESNEEDSSHFELADYLSDDEKTSAKAATATSLDVGVSSESQQLLEKLGLVFKRPSDEEAPPVDETKVFFCSRTHSQLTQFVQELRRVELPAPDWAVAQSDTKSDTHESAIVIKHLPLGSRKNLCVNPKVSSLGNVHAINERCLELQQPSTPKEKKCGFMPNAENQTLVDDFRNHTLAGIRDIEDLGALGKRIGICPYYASRPTIKPSEIVTLPYPLLLQKSAREALGISLKGHVIVIDEAHNLMDTIANIHSVIISRNQLEQCRTQIGAYLQKFRNRLKGKNRIYIAQLGRLVDSISAYLDSKAVGTGVMEGVAELGDVLAGKGVDQINLYKLLHYLQESKLARKIQGFSKYEEDPMSKDGPRSSSSSHQSTTPVLTHIQSFLQSLTNPTAEGKFFYERDDQHGLSLKYTLLDPTQHFRDVVEDARSVILAGGTMSPMEDYIQHLFSYVEPARIQKFSCGHIIPEDNLLALPASRSASGMDLEFTYEKRNSPAMIEALGDSLAEICVRVPDGLVVFFPSYAYLDQVIALWKLKNIWSRLDMIKPIFQESKTSGVEAILASYSEAISKNRGGLLLSVIGGKLSEGINFSDALGRGVVVVGLPYANVHTAQWQAKLGYIERNVTARTGSQGEGKAAARDFVENACMRAVNQSIGRAIRHKGDYASILLLDKRYQNDRIVGKLPAWIRQGLVRTSGAGFRAVTDALSDFFESKQRL